MNPLVQILVLEIIAGLSVALSAAPIGSASTNAHPANFETRLLQRLPT
jgi:hypothetical protein